MEDEKLNKSGNRRGMSKGSQEVVKKHNFKNRTKEELREISTKGHEAARITYGFNKTVKEIAIDESLEEVTNSKGTKVVYLIALVKKLKQMALNGNLNAMVLYLKLIEQMPAERQEIKNITPPTIIDDI